MVPSLTDCYRRLGFWVTKSKDGLQIGFKPEMVHAIVKEVWNERPLTRSDAERFYEKLSSLNKEYRNLYFRIVAHGGFLPEALDFELHGLSVSDENYIESLLSGRHVELYPHNEVAYRAITQGFKQHRIGAVVQATGTGKSYLLARYITDHAKEKILVFAPNITILENHFAVEIITQHHLGIEVTRRTPDIECYGAYVLDPDTQKIDTFLSKVTLMATGGTGAVYATTTNPNIATGDGIAMVYRAKGTVEGMEFVQFHPTALFHPGETHPAYLITEAMRGYGGILRLPNGEEFMQKYDKRLSLAPRDIVARAIDKEMKIHGLDHVCLDVTQKDAEETKHHFPNIYAKCLSIGIDMTKQYIPVVPCAHYMCGGIKVDLNACSSIRRLYAVGECSCTGLHGGNRLASNSLIEAVVYADAAAHHSLEVIDQYAFNDKIPEWNDEGTMSNEEKVLIAQDMKEVGQIMSNYVGIVRSDLRLKRAWTRLDLLYEETEELFKRVKATKDICELRNMINVGYLITRQAIERKESRGLHYTIDYPKHAYDQK